MTQALLPWFVMAWRWDVVEVIGSALEMTVEGTGGYRLVVAISAGLIVAGIALAAVVLR